MPLKLINRDRNFADLRSETEVSVCARRTENNSVLMRAVWFTGERLGISVCYANPEEFSKLQQDRRLLLSDKTGR